MHSFVKPGLFHISAETTECLIFGLKIFQKVACFFLVAKLTASQRDFNRKTASTDNGHPERAFFQKFESSGLGPETLGP